MKVRASSTAKFLACPNSVLWDEIFVSQDSEYAEEGTEAHAAAEAAILNGVAVPPQYEFVQMYVDEVKKQSPVTAPGLEVYNSIDITENLTLAGTADCVIHDPFTGPAIIDLKAGAGVNVEAENNSQIKAYIYLNFGVRGATGIIVQPRLGGVKTWKYSQDDINNFVHQLIAASEKVGDPDAYSTGSHCQFCPALPFCPKARAEIKEALSLTVLDISSVTDAFGENGIGKILELAELAGHFKNRATEFGHRAILAGGKADGWTVGPGRSSRSWVSDEKVIRLLHPILKDDLYAERKIESVAQVEKKIKALIKDSGADEEMANQVWDLFNQSSIRVSGKPTVTKEKSTKPKAASDGLIFDPIV